MTIPLKLISRRTLADRLDVHPRTIIRREREDPTFPKAIIINHRRYFDEAEASAYAADLIRRAMEVPVQLETCEGLDRHRDRLRRADHRR